MPSFKGSDNLVLYFKENALKLRPTLKPCTKSYTIVTKLVFFHLTAAPVEVVEVTIEQS